ncbi:salivary glue protein Sgs-3-like [Schistocerca cancellata]|uniref:salivary glue protein Sgs-3-like n=1 Tax=Schistocerca cancellata TaxID=274614 RepID=UPI0021190BEA|nr:salivary glue protein Sgs-3-like [Schistocerca cancellata]
MDRQKAVWIIFVLSTALSVTAAVSRPRWSPFAQRAYCSSPGEVLCSSDCSQVQICLGNLEDGYDPWPMITCSTTNGMKCSAVNRTCVPAEQSDCKSAMDQFPCNAVGSYPDPYDCKKYHVCLNVGEPAELGYCPGTDEAYNPLTADCTLTTSDRVCTEGPVKPCNMSLEVGVIPENQNIYYVCKPNGNGLDPVMYRCPAGMVFNVTLYSCVEPFITPEPTQTAAPPVTPPSTAESPVTPPSTAAPTEAPPSTAAPTETPPSTAAPTETPPSTAAPTETRPSTAAPTETPPSPSTAAPPVTSPSTQSPPSPGGECTTPAESTANPEDCHSFYKCNGETWVCIECIYGYHYDPQEETCIYGPCPGRRGLELLKYF